MLKYFLCMTVVVCLCSVIALCAHAQFYFPFTSGLNELYNFGTYRYGNLYGLQGIGTYGAFPPYYGLFRGFYPLGALWPFGCIFYL